MKSAVLFVFFVTSCHALMFMDVLLSEWELFKVEHEKKYSNVVEEKFRMKIYMENKKKIAEHNARYENGEEDFALKMNKFGDLMQHEFVDMMNGFNRMGRVYGEKQMSNETWQDSAEFISPASVQIPDSIDWRKMGAVTPVKDQGQCGSCWAFSATGSLEGQHFRSTKKLVSLSEQNLVDCSGRFGNMGCEGGTMDNAFKYVKYNRGIDSEMFYPYSGDDGSCHYNPKGSGATDVGYTDIQQGSEQKLMEAVATVGPVSVAIDASSDKFQFYSRGVYYDYECGNDVSDLDHGVLVVGYGTMQNHHGKNGTDYWIVKNSWGSLWGDQGYILMSRNRNNNCGIATLASYPLV